MIDRVELLRGGHSVELQNDYVTENTQMSVNEGIQIFPSKKKAEDFIEILAKALEF